MNHYFLFCHSQWHQLFVIYKHIQMHKLDVKTEGNVYAQSTKCLFCFLFSNMCCISAGPSFTPILFPFHALFPTAFLDLFFQFHIRVTFHAIFCSIIVNILMLSTVSYAGTALGLVEVHSWAHPQLDELCEWLLTVRNPLVSTSPLLFNGFASSSPSYPTAEDQLVVSVSYSVVVFLVME